MCDCPIVCIIVAAMQSSAALLSWSLPLRYLGLDAVSHPVARNVVILACIWIMAGFHAVTHRNIAAAAEAKASGGPAPLPLTALPSDVVALTAQSITATTITVTAQVVVVVVRRLIQHTITARCL